MRGSGEQALITLVWLLLWAGIAVFALMGLHDQPESVPSVAPERPPTPTQRGASNGLAQGSPVPSAASAVPSEPAVADDTSEETPKATPVPTPTSKPTARPKPTVRPEPVSSARGRASWHPAPQGHAAAPWGYWHMKPVRVRVTLISDPAKSVTVSVTGYCQCYVSTDTERLIDLPRVDFAKLADPEQAGLVWVTVERME